MNTLDRSKIHILVLDDESSVLFALKLLLQALGFQVSAYQSGEEALAFLQNAPLVDIFLSDLKMPKMNGIAVLSAAQMIKPSVPFVLMSAHASEDEVTLAKNLGAAEFLPKPFSADDLNRLVERVYREPAPGKEVVEPTGRKLAS